MHAKKWLSQNNEISWVGSPCKVMLIIMRDLNMTSRFETGTTKLCTIHPFSYPKARRHKSKLRCKKPWRQLSPGNVLGTPEGKGCAEWGVIYVGELETGGHRTKIRLGGVCLFL